MFIQDGALFGLREKMDDPDAQELVDRWIKTYGRGPFIGRRSYPDCVVLSDPNTQKDIHFSSTGYASINEGFVEPWQS
ncbi:MAG: hypothetical protein JW740_01350 [Candidatus Zambryskibacteria bacterium]|nr:hypothetical protein [Candidatus Zambryskibacteria bacterium]